MLARAGSPHFHRHFDARPQPVDHGHEALDADAPEIRVADAREIAGIDPGHTLCLPYTEALFVERLQLANIGIRNIEVPLNVSASTNHF